MSPGIGSVTAERMGPAYVVSGEMVRGYSNPITVGTILGTVTPGPWASLSVQSGKDIMLANIHEDCGLKIVKKIVVPRNLSFQST